MLIRPLSSNVNSVRTYLLAFLITVLGTICLLAWLSPPPGGYRPIVSSLVTPQPAIESCLPGNNFRPGGGIYALTNRLLGVNSANITPGSVSQKTLHSRPEAAVRLYLIEQRGAAGKVSIPGYKLLEQSRVSEASEFEDVGANVYGYRLIVQPNGKPWPAKLPVCITRQGAKQIVMVAADPGSQPQSTDHVVYSNNWSSAPANLSNPGKRVSDMPPAHTWSWLILRSKSKYHISVSPSPLIFREVWSPNSTETTAIMGWPRDIVPVKMGLISESAEAGSKSYTFSKAQKSVGPFTAQWPKHLDHTTRLIRAIR